MTMSRQVKAIFVISLLSTMTAGCASSGRVTDLTERFETENTTASRKINTLNEMNSDHRDAMRILERRLTRLEEKLNGVRFRIGKNSVQILREDL